ncbi:substrate-binding periplasmic protein [Roseateles violae]|uniref:Transporter substrate-binding domain-containing protein n=1 Tax=Roseateles violae TaxID=3058042 RepID=A0ABT8DM79_9BURK|nr:transporter substrate-binding domain-containing protein [Pelomonas sp. PFR6]MDN3919511.1 transporter substrate-binding domain-containing protein [Pelomonas sp. PFR6]
MNGQRRDAIKTAAAWALGAALTLEARAETAPPFRIAYFETYSPLSFTEAGAIKGILVDVLDEVIHRRLGLPRSHEGFPWPRAQALVQRGERDAICTIATPARLAYAQAAEEPVVTAPTTVFVRADHPRLAAFSAARDLAELRELQPSVLSYAANGWARERLGGFNVLWGNDFQSSLKMLVARRGDLMIENALTMQYSLRRLTGGDEIRMLPNRMDQAHFQLLVSRASAHLPMLPDFSRALRRFKQGPEYGEVFRRYGVQA